MIKSCKICEATLDNSDSRQVTCGSKECANKSRSLTNSSKAQQPAVSKPQTRYLRKEDLPPPECLPADYLKQCADHWLALTTEAEVIRRVV